MCDRRWHRGSRLLAALLLGAAAAEAPPCVDRDQTGNCKFWTEIGECEKNPSFMKLRCAACAATTNPDVPMFVRIAKACIEPTTRCSLCYRSCDTCDMLDYKKRCPIPENRTESLPPGRMTHIFERALSDFPQLEPQLLSPDPWVVSFERFLSPDEVAALLAHGEGRFAAHDISSPCLLSFFAVAACFPSCFLSVHLPYPPMPPPVALEALSQVRALNRLRRPARRRVRAAHI